MRDMTKTSTTANIKAIKDAALVKRIELMPSCLNEKQRRHLLAAEAKTYGRGGITKVSQLSGVARSTIRRGIKELNNPQDIAGGVRRKGGGRKKKIHEYRDLLPTIQKIVDRETCGDPESYLKWVNMSSRSVRDILSKEYNINISHNTVYKILRNELGYSLQANVKNLEQGKAHPDRNKQFEFINDTCAEFVKEHDPVISMDTKKKELIGNYENKGRTWQPKGKPIEVNSHDFPDAKVSKISPYAIYDTKLNKGYVNVGMSSDTGEFAVASIRIWWQKYGSKKYPDSRKVYICADSGGSNGYRLRLWKYELQKLSNETGVTFHVSHLPPGTSKWNKVEHRLLSHISMNWKGRPLTDYQMAVNTIASTTTREGLTVEAYLDENFYEKGIKVTDETMSKLNLTRKPFHGEWNYSIAPNENKEL